MKDPTTERARSVVILVIATVAVPSLLLTGLGAVAVENEEAAAKRRLEHAYAPIVWEAAQRFNARMDQLAEESAGALGALARASRDDDAEVDELRAFVKATGDLAVNYFVIGPDGEVLIPRDEESEVGENCESKRRPKLEGLLPETRPWIASARDPLKLQSLAAARATANRLIEGLGKQETWEVSCTRDILRAIGERGPMLDQLSTLSRPRETEVRFQTIETNDWRRVIVAQSIEDYFVGFELVPCTLEPLVNGALVEKGLSDVARAYLHPIQLPKQWTGEVDWTAYEDRVLSWTLLKKTNLAWKLEILREEKEGLLSMTTSRSTLYFWALILLVGALIAGIGYTIRAVAREARMARLKTDFVSSVSHDLRTPLTSIRLFTETLLLGRATSREEEREFLQVIADETDRLSRLTERILDFSRMEAGRKAYQFTCAEVPELVDQALRACRPMIEEARFEVTTDYQDALPPIDVDRDASVEVLINLISNAIKYSPSERSISIRASCEGSRVAIAVSDRGIGIAAAEQTKIFEKFYRVDSRRAYEVGGTGLGLSLVQHIVTAHGGEVTVRSALDEGSTFTVWLPARPA